MLRAANTRRWWTVAATDPARRSAVLAAVTLVLAVTPIVVAVVRAVATGWVPIGDSAYFTVRSRDVLTAHHPWLGAWSSGSETIGATVRNLGPLQLDLLAPFTKLDPYWGTAAGVGAVAAGSVVAVWWAARRRLGPLGASAAMLATIVLEATVGLQTFIDPRQQLYLLLPYWALLWLAWSVALGDGAAIPPFVLVASLIIQTHFTYVLQTGSLVVVAIALFIVATRRQWRDTRTALHWMAAGLGVGLVCWAQPLWDQFFGDGNLGTVFAERSSHTGVGWETGPKIVASAVLVPPRFWLPGTMGAFDLPTDLVTLRAAWIAVVVWLVLVCVSAAVAWRRGCRAFAFLGLIAALAFVLGLAGTARTPAGAFGLSPQNYFWLWPVAVFMTVAVAAGALAVAPEVRRWLASGPGAVGALLVGLVIAIVASSPAAHFVNVPSERTAGERVARPIVEELARGLRRHGVTGPVVVDFSRTSFHTYLRYAFLAELQRAGIEFTFPAGDRNLERFGHDRCEHGDATARIYLADATGGPAAEPGEVVLAGVDAFSGADRSELAELDRRFGDRLRDGQLGVDLALLDFLGGEIEGLPDVLAGRAATGLAEPLATWTAWDVVDVPGELREDFDRWLDLEARSVRDEVTILLAPVDDTAANAAC